MVEMGLEGTSNGEEIQWLKTEPVNKGFGFECMNDSADGSSGAREGVRTYKRRRQLSSNSKIQVQDCGKASTGQVTFPGTDHCTDLNDSKYRLQRKGRNVVLEHMHQLSGDEGGIQSCIQDALLFHRENGCNVTMKDSEKLEAVISNGSLNEAKPQTTTEMCHVFFEVIISEKFTSLCKLLFDNFQGIKLDSLFHLSLINSRMKNGAYEHSPMLFSTEIQQIWRKLQEIGAEIASLTKSLSNISNTSYREQIGCSSGAVEEEKHEFCTRESEPRVKLEQTEASGVYKVCTCKHCGDKADGKTCLVCDSCEEMYHVSCIEPAMKEIPPKSWFCASCSAKGIGSPHESCVICQRLNAPGTLDNNIADENHNGNCEIFSELEETSTCSIDMELQLSPQSKIPHVCKICGSNIKQGEKFRSCEHPYCPNVCYHVRCLTIKQLKSYCSCWYCPSCLCRICFVDKDDDKIVLCDGCDAAYHLYCMKPPRISIPKGKWFCRKCDAGIKQMQRAKRAYQNQENKMKMKGIGGKLAYDNLDMSRNQKNEEDLDKRRAKRAYQNQENKMKMKGIGGKLAYDNLDMSRNQKNEEDLDKSRGGVDMLLTAASTLHLEEKLNAIQMKT